MKLAIVILNWNGRDMIARFLPTVLKYSKNEATVIVADNASTDDSLELLASMFPEVRTIVLSENYGFAGGYNRALAIVDAEYYLLLNSDVEVTDGWLAPLLAFMDARPDCAACQPKLLSECNRRSFEYAGASGGFIDKYGYPFCRGRIFDVVESDEGQYDDDMEIFWATGACLMVRSLDFRLVGGFDERFFAHNEEIDLCWRLNLMGRKIYCVPSSRVYHVGGGTLPKSNPMKTFLNFRNNLTMLYKNLDADEFRHVMRVRMVLDYVAAFKILLLDRNPGEFRAILRARRAFRKWLPMFSDSRAEVQGSRVVSRVRTRLGISLLWQYYVRGRRKFSQL